MIILAPSEAYVENVNVCNESYVINLVIIISYSRVYLHEIYNVVESRALRDGDTSLHRVRIYQ